MNQDREPTWQDRLRDSLLEWADGAFNDEGTFNFALGSRETEDCPVRYYGFCALQEGPTQTDCETCEMSDCFKGGGPPLESGCRMFWECAYMEQKAETQTCPLLLSWFAELLADAKVHIPSAEELTT